MIWLLIGVLIAFAGWAILKWYAHADPALVKKGLAGFILLFLVLVSLALIFTGRASAALPFLFGCFFAYQRLRAGLGFAQFIKRLWGASTGREERPKSIVETSHLRMTLDTRSGALEGDILQGIYKDQKLSGLAQSELLEKYQELRREDGEGARLLESYLDRVVGPDWRAGTQQSKSADADTSGPMSLSQAAQILGVDVAASKKEIISAHRRLMKAAHPDQGGSDYLARQINAAKDTLIARTQ